jgi:competence protein ComEC
VPAGRLSVTFLPVGQGDAALVRFPDGRTWLVDGGPPGADTLAWLRRSGVRTLDTVVLSHPHPDHMAGLVPVLRALPVRRVWVPRPPEAGEAAFLTFWQAAWASGARVGVPLHLPGGEVEVLHPVPGWHATGRRRVNDESIVLGVRHGERTVLLTGDVEAEGEAALVARGLGRADVVKAPHHGSRSSSGPALVAAVSAEWVVVSCGTDNRHGHPHAAALGRWWGARRARTDQDGAVRFTTDGHDLRASRWVDGRGWVTFRRSRWSPSSPKPRLSGDSRLARDLTLP